MSKYLCFFVCDAENYLKLSELQESWKFAEYVRPPHDLLVLAF